jgi:hypothetical protein
MLSPVADVESRVEDTRRELERAAQDERLRAERFEKDFKSAINRNSIMEVCL